MSIDTSIGEILVTAVQSLTLMVTVAPLPAASVIRSKTPSLPPGTHPPKIVVVVGDRPSKVEFISSAWKLSYWPCSIVIFAGDGAKQADDDRSRTWRAQIEAIIFDQQSSAFAGLASFNEVNASDKSAFDPAALDKDIAALTSNFEVQVIESRAG